MKRKNKSITHLLSICRILCLIILTTIVSQRGTFAQVDPTISDSQEKKKEAVPETKSAVRGVYTLGEIVVASPRETREGAGSISIIGADDIKRQNAQSLGEALQLVPGAYFRQSRYQQGNYVSLRGFDRKMSCCSTVFLSSTL
jgi:outer membrane receptor for ferric coprogen and ferric-rhodotorulic acid